MSRHGRRAVLAAAIFFTGALGNWGDTTTGIDLSKLPQFPLTRIRSGFLQDGSRVTFDGMTSVSHVNAGDVVLRCG
jgi:hypothetical protein